jgi:transient receptor potential cation channel subfamily M protein 2
MIQFMFNDEGGGWGMRKPNLILSITGGAQKFSLPYMVKKAFKQGLVKAAASTGAWIITGGTNAGVMKLVGDAVADEGRKYGCDFTVIGVASWGKIALRHQMTKNRLFVYGKNEVSCNARSSKTSLDANDPLLDPNHTHFILVDDGSDSKFGVEIPFRARLESELRKGKPLKYYEQMSLLREKRQVAQSEQKSLSSSELERLGVWSGQDESGGRGSDLNVDGCDEVDNTVPMILIVVQGGPNTLKTVIEAIGKKIPILILVVSKKD